jgi:O-antigen chain-terminating methyltransferase
MTDSLPTRPAPIPLPDRYQIEHLNDLCNLAGASQRTGWQGRLVNGLRIVLSRLLSRQQAFNAAVVDHINRNAVVGIEAHRASAHMLEWVEEAVLATPDLSDELRRHQEALAARDVRRDTAVRALAASHDELRVSVGMLQQAVQSLKRDLERRAAEGPNAAAPPAASSASPSADLRPSSDSHKYVGFEDEFRGSPDDIRRRVSEYLPLFRGSTDVLDVGCGRGEFLTLLRQEGLRARGIDVNNAMVEVCRSQGLDATHADALTYIRAQPDGSLGGLFAAQVIEHLEPAYLTELLDAAFDKLRPGAPIVLETINPACWFAFFESYLRDITHVRAIHPDTLKFLLIASGFQRIEIRYRAPYPEHEKLQPIAPHAALGDSVETLNANVERINRLLFTWLDYAAIGRRP